MEEPLDLTGDGGVLKIVKQAGEGDQSPEIGDEIVMQYTGKLEDGTVFDSSITRGKPFQFRLGKGSVIKGWDIVTPTMKMGEVAEVKLAAGYAYGETGSPPKIPPNASLVFEMELVRWISARDLLEDGSVIKTFEEEGSSWERPGEYARVDVKVVAKQIEPGPEKVIFDGEKTFPIGMDSAYRAWERAVRDMKRGGKVKILCTGENVRGPGIDFVPKEALKVEYELTLVNWLKIEDLSGDRGVMKTVVKEGEGWETPNEGALVTVRIEYRVVKEGVAGDIVEKHSSFIFRVINGAVVDGVDKAVQKMKNKEIAVVHLTAPYAYGSCPNMCSPNFKPTDELEVRIELLSFERAKDSWSMTLEEKIEQIKECKKKGNQLFSVGRLKLARRHYEIAVGLFEYSTSELKAEMAKEVQALTTACHLNIAACYKKEGNNEKILFHTNKALEIEPLNVKALYRRGCAFMDTDNYYKAQQDLKHALDIDPNNMEVRRKLKELAQLMAKQDALERGLYANIFSKAL